MTAAELLTETQEYLAIASPAVGGLDVVRREAANTVLTASQQHVCWLQGLTKTTRNSDVGRLQTGHCTSNGNSGGTAAFDAAMFKLMQAASVRTSREISICKPLPRLGSGCL